MTFYEKMCRKQEISISLFSNIPFILKSKIKQVFQENISENPGLRKFLKEKIKPLTQRVK